MSFWGGTAGGVNMAACHSWLVCKFLGIEGNQEHGQIDPTKVKSVNNRAMCSLVDV